MVLHANYRSYRYNLLDADEKVAGQGQASLMIYLNVYVMNANLQLQIAYSKFLTFNRNTRNPPLKFLGQRPKNSPLNNYGKSFIKSTLGDILVL